MYLPVAALSAANKSQIGSEDSMHKNVIVYTSRNVTNLSMGETLC